MATNRQIRIVELPKGKLGQEHFRLESGPIPSPKDGELLLRTRFISLDAASRAWMNGPTYRAAIEAGQVMAGAGLAEVVESKAPGFAPGDLVFSDTGWQDYAVLPARAAMKVTRQEPLSHLLSVYASAGSRRISGSWTSASRRRVKPSSSRRPRVRSAPSSRRSPRSRAAVWWASPAARRNAPGSRRNSASMAAVDYKGRRRLRGAQGSCSQRHRHLFRQCRRRNLGGVLAADESPRPHRLLRPPFRNTTVPRRRQCGSFQVSSSSSA